MIVRHSYSQTVRQDEVDSFPKTRTAKGVLHMAQAEKLFAPMKNKRSFEEVASRIKELILDGTLKVGDRLPAETQLAEDFNVGRQTIREALRMLEQSGFVSIQRGGGGGSVIKNTVLQHISDLLINVFRMRSVTLEDLTAARMEIERMIIVHAMNNADDQDLARLQENITAARKRIDEGRTSTELNTEFHKLLAKASKNEVFVIVIETLMAVHLDLLSRAGSGLATSRKVVEAHERIVQAMTAGDRILAQRLMEEHVEEVRTRLDKVEKIVK